MTDTTKTKSYQLKVLAEDQVFLYMYPSDVFPTAVWVESSDIGGVLTFATDAPTFTPAEAIAVKMDCREFLRESRRVQSELKETELQELVAAQAELKSLLGRNEMLYNQLNSLSQKPETDRENASQVSLLKKQLHQTERQREQYQDASKRLENAVDKLARGHDVEVLRHGVTKALLKVSKADAQRLKALLQLYKAEQEQEQAERAAASAEQKLLEAMNVS